MLSVVVLFTLPIGGLYSIYIYNCGTFWTSFLLFLVQVIYTVPQQGNGNILQMGATINPFIPSGLFYLTSLDKSISYIRGVMFGRNF